MKRMIDNKEFDKLLKDVDDISEKVDNIKDIPTITIDLSQMLSENSAQLTDEQFEIVENNNFINFVDPNGNKYSMSLYQDSENHRLTIFSSGLLDDENIIFFQVSIDKTTKVATIVDKTISTGKKLYQHNITIKSTDICFSLNIINDNNTPINSLELLKTFLIDNNFIGTSAIYPLTGGFVSGNALNIAIGLFKHSTYNEVHLYYVKGSSLLITSEQIAGLGSFSYYDTIIEL